MCRSVPGPLVCTCDYLQTWIRTEAHTDFYLCSDLGTFLRHSLWLLGYPQFVLFPICLANVQTLPRQGEMSFLPPTFFLFSFIFCLILPSVLKLQLYSVERGNTKACSRSDVGMHVYVINGVLIHSHSLRNSGKPLWTPTDYYNTRLLTEQINAVKMIIVYDTFYIKVIQGEEGSIPPSRDFLGRLAPGVLISYNNGRCK